jgi:transposase
MLAVAVSGFVPVAVTPEAPRAEAPIRDLATEPPSVVEIVLASGATIRISGRVDVTVLRTVLAELGGR